VALTGIVFAIPQEIPARTAAIDDEYRQVMDARGRQSETIRLERLISLYMQDKRGRLTSTVVNGQKALYVSLSDSEVAQAKERAGLALTAVRSIKEDDLPPTAKVDFRMLLHLTTSDVDLAQFPTEYFAPYRREYWYPVYNNAATWRFSDLPRLAR
jgi:hypothetical protein